MVKFRVHKGRPLVYNGGMSIPASLIASIVSAIIESAVSPSAPTAAQYEVYVTKRTLPPEAKLGVMQPPQGNGFVVISDKAFRLAPGVQFRGKQNMIVMSSTILAPSDVVYLTDATGAVFRVWLLSPAEKSAYPKN